jgi:hypothetical protein
MKLNLGMTLLATTLLSTSAMALTQKVNIDLNGAHLRGMDEVPLSRMLVRKIGRQAMRGWKLDKAVVSAKSKQGAGQISLLVGHSESFSKVVPGTPEGFESDFSGFSDITLHAPSSFSRRGLGRMELLTQGNIKLNDVDVLLKKTVQYDSQNTRGMHFIRKVEFKAQKLVGSSKTIRPRGRVLAIELVGTKRKVHVDKVEIKYLDGQVIIIDELDGKLKDGRSKVFTLKGPLAKPIKTIKVSASSNSLFGSRGRLAVNIAQ